MSGIGHNSGDEVMSSKAQAHLRSYTDRIMRLMEDKDNIQADIKEVFAEAKGEGFDTKIMRKAIAAMKQDKAKREEELALLELYLEAMDL